MVLSMHLYFLARILVSLHRIQWLMLTVRSAMADIPMVQPDMVMMFFNPVFQATASLSKVNFLTLAGDAIDAWCFKRQVILMDCRRLS
jgi:hypothetical protein